MPIWISDTRDLRRGSGSRLFPRRGERAGLWILLATTFACGVKGPPLPPAPKRPEPVTSLSVRQEGDAVIVRFAPPTRREDGRPLDPPVRFDLMAAIAGKGAAGAPPVPVVRKEKPAAAELSRFDKSAFIAGSVQVAKLSGPGGRKPSASEARPVGEIPGGTAPGKRTAGALEIRLVPADLPNFRLASSRLTLGVAVVDGRGRRSPPGDLVTIEPIMPLPAPSDLALGATAAGVSLTWTLPGHEEREAVPTVLNLYRWFAEEPEALGPMRVLDAASTGFLDTEAPQGRRLVYELRLGAAGGPPFRESVTAGPVEIDYRDTFPPAAPTGLIALPDTTGIRLFWDAVADRDLAGYRVWKAEGAGATGGAAGAAAPGGSGEGGAAAAEITADGFRLLTPKPIPDTTFRDLDVAAGVSVTYRVTAVDGAVPPNESVPSETVSETPVPPGEEGPSGDKPPR